MQVQNVSNSPKFGAKIIIGDEGVQKFIKSSFMAKGREMHDLLDTFNKTHKKAIVTISTRTGETGDYLLARNGVTGQSDICLLSSAQKVDLKSRSAFYDLVTNLLKNKDFWNKMNNDAVDMTSVKPIVEHDVFKLK